MKRAISAGFALAAATLLLAGCGRGEDPGREDQATGDAPAAGMAAVEGPEGITVRDARLALPAVPGNPGAVYFTLANAGEIDFSVASAFVSDAGMAMLHRTVTEGGMARMTDAGEIALPAGGSVAFEPGGLHVMAMDLADTLAQGGSTEVTLTFANGDKVSFPATIVGPGGGAAGDHEG